MHKDNITIADLGILLIDIIERFLYFNALPDMNSYRNISTFFF